MADYRLYFMDPRSGHIVRFAEYEAPHDSAAIALARDKEGQQPLELWSGGRKVKRIEAIDPAPKIVARWAQGRAGLPSAG